MLRTLTAVAFCAACTATPSTPAVSERAVYVRDAATLVTSDSERARLTAAISSGEVTEVVPYGLGSLLATESGRAALTQWITELHGNGARVVAPVSSIARVESVRSLDLDGLVTELEFWNRADRAAAFAEEMELLTRMHEAVPQVGAYLGYPTDEETRELSASLDFVFLNYNVPDPADAYDHHVGSHSLRARFEAFAAAGTPIWPIFYATGEADMQAALAADGASAAERAFLGDVANDTAVQGFTYFAFEALPERW